MGYYTRYSLSITPGDHPDVPKAWEEIKGNEDLVYAIGEDETGGEEPCKWYEHEEDMLALSRKFPALTFKLNGEGEEAWDIWEKYFRDGKKQICKAQIMIPPMREDAWVDGDEKK